MVRARTGRFSANLEFESLLTRVPSRITFGARNVEFYSQLILTNPYEVRLATSLSGDKEANKAAYGEGSGVDSIEENARGRRVPSRLRVTIG